MKDMLRGQRTYKVKTNKEFEKKPSRVKHHIYTEADIRNSEDIKYKPKNPMAMKLMLDWLNNPGNKNQQRKNEVLQYGPLAALRNTEKRIDEQLANVKLWDN